MDRLKRWAFVADVSFDGKTERERKEILGKILRTLADALMADVQTYIQLTEVRKVQKMDDGEFRQGTEYTLDVMIGKRPLVKMPSGRDVSTSDEQLVTVGNN